MKKQTQLLCIFLMCCLTLMASGCGIRPSKLISPTEAQKERLEEENKDTSHVPATPTFPAVYPKPAR